MQMNISRLMDLLRIDVRLRDILLCHASPDDMQNDGDLSSQFQLQRGYTTSNVPACLVQLITAQSATQGGTNSVTLQIDQNLVDMSLTQSPVSSESSQKEYIESAENGSPIINQHYDYEIIHIKTATSTTTMRKVTQILIL